MEKLKLDFEVDFCQLEELTEDERILVQKAIDATHNAYAIYSNFNVGAAVRLANGEIYIGANQENAAYPSGLCAERTAIFAAQACEPTQPICSIAVAASNTRGMTEDPVSPCGACRQVMVQVESRYNQPMQVLLYGTKGVYRFKTSRQLMPFSFIENSMR